MRTLLAAAVLLAAHSASATVVCKGANTVEGIDVSYYQGDINWTKVAGTGRKFAITRISDGTGYIDTKFAANWSGIKAAGMIRGAYQFFRPGDDANAQADLVIQKVGKLGPGDLPVTVDVEATDGQSKATITAKLHTWINKVEAGTGKKPIVYTGKYFWNDNVGSNDFAGYPLWLAAYVSGCPDTPTAWNKWRIWQYNDNGAINGIAGNVDIDVFDGTLADLNALADGGADYAAGYVKQSWPLAAEAIHLVTNQKLPASIELRNTGKKTWDLNTRFGTSAPRDRQSAFFSSDWLSPDRAAEVAGTVKPGATFDFKFTFQAPMQPGEYHEFFTLVQEGVAWFSDDKQGGPPDKQIEAWIVVDRAAYGAEIGKLSLPPTVKLKVGETSTGTVELKNAGTATWKAGEVRLAPTPHDQASPVAAADSLSPTRVSTLDHDVAPGETAVFTVSLAGNADGTFMQTFGLVAEKITWFDDAPKGGGPSDDQLAIKVEVGTAAINGDTGGVGSGGDDKRDGTGNPAGGCSVTPNGGNGGFFLLICALLLVLRQRARKRS